MDTETLDLAVGGMTCAGCANNIQRGLSEIPGVGQAVVNVATRRASITLADGADEADVDTLARAAITGLGYKVLTPERVAEHASHQAGEDHSGHDHSSHGGGASYHSGGGDGASRGSHQGHGMDRADEHAAHMAADAAQIADYRRRFFVALALTVPLAAISMVSAWQFSNWGWVVLALSTPVIFWSAWPYHRSAFKSARHGATTMDTLVSLGTLASWMWSTVVLLQAYIGPSAHGATHGHLYYETGAVITTLILLGKWIEVRSTARAGDAIRALSEKQSSTVELEDGTIIAREDLKQGMSFVVRPGSNVATDGQVVSGRASVDSSLVTGESVPVGVTEGADVVGGTTVIEGHLVVRATKVGSQTLLAQIARMVDEAQAGKARIQRLADRISAIFVPAVIALSLITWVSWWLISGDIDKAFTAAVAVLIISCPCALGLATPLAIMVGTGRGAQLGVLIRGPEVLEDARDIDVVVLDKTGTVTNGDMKVLAHHGGDDTLLTAIASVEARSEHPIAHAIAAEWSERALLKGFTSITGKGAAAVVQGAGVSGADTEVTVGSRSLFDEVSDELESWAADQESQGRTVIFGGRAAVPASAGVGIGLGGGGLSVRRALSAEVAIAVADTVKDGAADAVSALKNLGAEVHLLSGDNQRVVSAVAASAGITTVAAEVLPADKANVIISLQGEGKRVAMVGDGINDAPALAGAHLGIAMGTGTDVAREASDLTIVSGDVRKIPQAIRLARATFGTIRGNLFWAFAYNVAAIPLAAFGILDPMIAAAAMGASSLFVVGNSLRLRRFS